MFVSDPSDRGDTETCSSLWGGQQRESSLQCHSPTETPSQRTWPLGQAARGTIGMLATTFVLIAAQCMPSCAIRIFFFPFPLQLSRFVLKNCSLWFHLKDKKSHIFLAYKGAFLFPRHQISFVCKLYDECPHAQWAHGPRLTLQWELEVQSYFKSTWIQGKHKNQHSEQGSRLNLQTWTWVLCLKTHCSLIHGQACPQPLSTSAVPAQLLQDYASGVDLVFIK